MLDILERLQLLDCDCNDSFICSNCEAIKTIKALRLDSKVSKLLIKYFIEGLGK